MTDQKVTQLSADTTPSTDDLVMTVNDPGGTPASKKVTLSNLFSVIWAAVTNAATAKTTPIAADKLSIVDTEAVNVIKSLTIGDFIKAYYAPDGVMINGKLSVTVASNNITVALKTLAGNNPSTTDPVYCRINGTVRACTAALSVTKNAGTNWCNSGSAELATKEVDYFAYLIWNTTPATDIMDIGFSRKPYFNLYSEASGTTTNESYLAFGNASTPTAGDDLTVVGRFAATLSAGAGYTWTVPSYTSTNLIQRPIYTTRELSYVPVFSAITVSNGTLTGVYQLDYRRLFFRVTLIFGSSSAMADSFCSIPFTPAAIAGVPAEGKASFLDSGTATFEGTVKYISTTNLQAFVYNASGTYTTASVLSSTVPMTWTTSDAYYLYGDIGL